MIFDFIKDVVIFGNGLAAYSLALQLQKKGIDTLIVRKSVQNTVSSDWWEHVQLPFINEIKKLADVDGLPEWTIPCNRISSAWSTTQPIFTTSSNHFHIHKRGLIDHLLSVVDKVSITKINGQLSQMPDLNSKGWNLLIKTGEQKNSRVLAKFWIDATGRNSAIVNRYYTDRSYFDDHIALTKYFLTDNSRHGTVFSIESIEYGWWYVLISDHWTQATLITNPTAIKSFSYNSFYHHCLSRSYYTRGYIQSNIQTLLPIVSDARMGITYQTSSDYWSAVGEAAWSTDPLCGQGNQVCLDQVNRITDEIYRALRENKSLSHLDKINHRDMVIHLKETQKYYFMEQRWKSSPFWNNVFKRNE